MNLSNEQRLIAILLRTPNIIDDYEYINSSHIMNDLNRDIFQSIINMRNKDEFITPHTLKQYLTNKNDSHNYIDFLSNSNIDVREFDSVCKQQLDITLDFNINKLQQSISEIRLKDSVDSSEKIQEIEDIFNGFVNGNETSNEYYNIKEVFKSYLNELATESYIKPTFGIERLNDKCPTANNKGESTIIAGPPSIGKTLFLQSIYKNAILEDKGVAVFSTEMSKEQLMSRLIADIADMDGMKLNRKEYTPSQINQKIGASDYALNVMKKLGENLFLFDGDMQVEKLKQECRKINRKHGLDIILVDYLQNLRTFKKFGSDNETSRVAYISKELTSTAKVTDSAMYALAQLNRECLKRTNKRALASDIKNSSEIEQDASIIITLYRDDLFNSNSPLKGYMEFNIVKNRYGEIGTVISKTNLKHSRIEEIPEEEEKEVLAKIDKIISNKK